jgi:hypothetical protein
VSAVSKPIVLRAAITQQEWERIKIAAIRSRVPAQEYVAALLRVGLAQEQRSAGTHTRLRGRSR